MSCERDFPRYGDVPCLKASQQVLPGREDEYVSVMDHTGSSP